MIINELKAATDVESVAALIFVPPQYEMQKIVLFTGVLVFDEKRLKDEGNETVTNCNGLKIKFKKKAVSCPKKSDN